MLNRQSSPRVIICHSFVAAPLHAVKIHDTIRRDGRRANARAATPMLRKTRSKQKYIMHNHRRSPIELPRREPRTRSEASA